jgi:hypothetical protein
VSQSFLFSLAPVLIAIILKLLGRALSLTMDLPMFLVGLLPGLLANLKRLLGVPIITSGSDNFK